MATLITLQGPNSGQPFTLVSDRSLIGRRPDSTVFLESPAVAREHAQIVWEGGGYFIEDLGSLNGTFLNGQRLRGRAPFTEKDTLQIGPYVFRLQPAPDLHATESDPIIEKRAEHEIAALQAQAWTAFSRDLNALLQTSPGKWVAYRGTDRLCTGKSPSAVYEECQRRGFAPDELFVELVYPAATEELTVFLGRPPGFPEEEP